MEGTAWRARHGGHGMEGTAWRAPSPPRRPSLAARSVYFGAVAFGHPRHTRAYTSSRVQRPSSNGERGGGRHGSRALVELANWEFSPLVVFALDARSVCIRGPRQWRSMRTADGDDLSQLASGAAGVTARERRDSFGSSDWNSSSRRPRSPLAASAFVALASGAPRERPMARTVVQTRAQRQRRWLWTEATFFAMVMFYFVVCCVVFFCCFCAPHPQKCGGCGLRSVVGSLEW